MTDRLTNRPVGEQGLTRYVGAAARRVERFAKPILYRRRLRRLVADLPPSAASAAEWLITGRATAEEQALTERIEGLRAGLAQSDQKMSSYYAPLPGTFTTTEDGHAVPGPRKKQSARAHSRTGSKPRKGIALRRITAGSGAQRVLELGTNTGLSACWMASAPQVPALVTVEGSPELTEVARGHVAQFSDRVEVRNAMFDDALADLADEPPFDLAFIDGQHEGAATLHYSEQVCQRLRPDGGIVLYDDIYWSRDMLAAWRRLVATGPFTLTVDLGLVGMAVMGSGPRRHVDLIGLLGRPHVPRRIGDG